MWTEFLKNISVELFSGKVTGLQHARFLKHELIACLFQ